MARKKIGYGNIIYIDEIVDPSNLSQQYYIFIYYVLILRINIVCIQPIILWRYCCPCNWIYSQCYPGACAIFYRTHTVCDLKLPSSVSSQITVCLLYIIQVRYRTYCRLTSLQMYVCNDNDVEELWWCHISMSLYFPVVFYIQ